MFINIILPFNFKPQYDLSIIMCNPLCGVIFFSRFINNIIIITAVIVIAIIDVDYLNMI